MMPSFMCDDNDRDYDGDFDLDDLDADNNYEDLGVQGCALPWPPENCIEMWKAEKAQVVSNCMQ